MPDKTLLAFADHGAVKGVMAADGREAERMLARFREAGVDLDVLARKLQEEGAASFVTSWDELLERIAGKSAQLARAAAH
jgi:transaldolase